MLTSSGFSLSKKNICIFLVDPKLCCFCCRLSFNNVLLVTYLMPNTMLGPEEIMLIDIPGPCPPRTHSTMEEADRLLHNLSTM